MAVGWLTLVGQAMTRVPGLNLRLGGVKNSRTKTDSQCTVVSCWCFTGFTQPRKLQYIRTYLKWQASGVDLTLQASFTVSQLWICIRSVSDQFVIVGRFRVVWDWLSFEWLDAEEELCEVVKDAAGVRVVIFTGSSVLEIIVALVVEHLVARYVHGGVQELKRRGSWDSGKVCPRRFDFCSFSHREPRK